MALFWEACRPISLNLSSGLLCSAVMFESMYQSAIWCTGKFSPWFWSHHFKIYCLEISNFGVLSQSGVYTTWQQWWTSFPLWIYHYIFIGQNTFSVFCVALGFWENKHVAGWDFTIFSELGLYRRSFCVCQHLFACLNACLNACGRIISKSIVGIKMRFVHNIGIGEGMDGIENG